MPATQSSTFAALADQLFEALAEAGSATVALSLVDRLRRVIAGDGIFSIQQNVTTVVDPVDEIRLQRFYSSEAHRFPVHGTKRKTLTPWVECLFLHGRVFVGEGTDVLACTFDDFDQMRPFDLQSVINVPLMHGNLCYATFNVFGTRARWSEEEVLGIQRLAVAAARWVPAAPGLAYRFNGTSFNRSLEN
jgi:hypothetical protein